MRVDPYLHFHGRCADALAFYGQAIGARVEFLTRFGETRGMPSPAHLQGKVMHAVVRIGEANMLHWAHCIANYEAILLATDGGASEPQTFQGFALALAVESDAEAEAMFAALSDGGQVTVPMGPTPFAARFGILTDRFGVNWNVVRQEGQP